MTRIGNRVRLALVLSMLVAPATAAPPPSPVGPEIQVNTTPATASRVSVAAFPNGEFVVAWTGAGPRARFFDRNGQPAGGECSLPIDGFLGQVAAERNGSFVATWIGLSPASEPIVYAGRFDRQCARIGEPIVVSDGGPGDRLDPLIAFGNEGRFVVAWESGRTDGSGVSDAVARVLNRRGRPLTPELLLAEGTPAGPAGDDAESVYPTIVAVTPDDAVLGLVQLRGTCNRTALMRVSQRGRREFLDGSGCVSEVGSALALRPEGRFVATWSDFNVLAQRYKRGGKRFGARFHLSPADGRQNQPVVAVGADGSLVFAWTEGDGVDGDGHGVFGRGFAPSAKPRGSAFQVNVSTAGDQERPVIAASPRGTFLVVWLQSATPDGPIDVFARLLKPTRSGT